MKKLLALVTLMIIATTAFAQMDAGDNAIGVYTTTTAVANCRTTMVAVQANLTTYLMATRFTNSHGMSGYECGVAVVLPGGLELVDPPTVTLPAGWLNVGTWPNFQCAGGPSNPVLNGPTIQLAKIVIANYVGDDPETADPLGTPSLIVAVGPCNPSSFGAGTLWPQYPTGPGYADGQDPGILARLVPSSNTPAGPPNFFKVYAAGPGACPVVPEGNTSWSDVKALYR